MQIAPKSAPAQGYSKAVLAENIGVILRTIFHWIATGQLQRDLVEVAHFMQDYRRTMLNLALSLRGLE